MHNHVHGDHHTAYTRGGQLHAHSCPCGDYIPSDDHPDPHDEFAHYLGPFVDIVFDGPPGPESGRFVEVEDHTGASRRLGKWKKRPDGYWALRFNRKDLP